VIYNALLEISTEDIKSYTVPIKGTGRRNVQFRYCAVTFQVANTSKGSVSGLSLQYPQFKVKQHILHGIV